MIVAGIMSGTSADGINVAFCRITKRGASSHDIKLLAHEEFAYPRAARTVILDAMDAHSISVAELSRLNFRLGELYADAFLQTARKHKIKGTVLIGCHGQTLYHQGEPTGFLGAPITCTWQTGEAAVLAAKSGVSVVSDFRPADMAAGGKGAPLVPFFDFTALRHATRGRILLNLGGIANITVVPASASINDIFAFDTGPSNMVIDACITQIYGKAHDANGKIAARGKVIPRVLSS